MAPGDGYNAHKVQLTGNSTLVVALLVNIMVTVTYPSGPFLSGTGNTELGMSHLGKTSKGAKAKGQWNPWF